MNTARPFKTLTPEKEVSVREPDPSAATAALSAVEKASEGEAGVDNITLNFVIRTRGGRRPVS